MQNRNPLPIRLKQARQKIGISQRELGLRIGLEPSSASSRMNHYEKGRHTPDFEALERIAKELGVPVAYFFCQAESSAELIRLIEGMTEQERRSLLEKIKGKD
ncbi:helix-turn-helix domain-containing protein [Ferrimonas futtsuensis]|uniref:helix-turn-helix domain-containing protein n=1 Tax=Ferrimonas futtsuensis TaxID=364764 RepID=UPI000401B1B5|nr:helix-turn-helix transcriptional regulator [Ferrimonas futtsuensis]